MVFHKILKQDEFENIFLYTNTEQFKGQKFQSLDDIAHFMADKYPDLNFHDYKLVPVVSDDLNSVLRPFHYITAIKENEPVSCEHLGFKIDSEPVYRLGPPHFEASLDKNSVGFVGGYKLYESSEKKYKIFLRMDI